MDSDRSIAGGKTEAEDGGDAKLTAVREAREEVGLNDDNCKGLEVVCELDRLISANGLLTTPTVRYMYKTRHSVPEPRH